MSKYALGGRDGDQEKAPLYLVKFPLQFIEEITVMGNVHLKLKVYFPQICDRLTGSQVLVRPALQGAGQSAPCVVSALELGFGTSQ